MRQPMRCSLKLRSLSQHIYARCPGWSRRRNRIEILPGFQLRVRSGVCLKVAHTNSVLNSLALSTVPLLGFCDFTAVSRLLFVSRMMLMLCYTSGLRLLKKGVCEIRVRLWQLATFVNAEMRGRRMQLKSQYEAICGILGGHSDDLVRGQILWARRSRTSWRSTAV